MKALFIRADGSTLMREIEDRAEPRRIIEIPEILSRQDVEVAIAKGNNSLKAIKRTYCLLRVSPPAQFAIYLEP